MLRHIIFSLILGLSTGSILAAKPVQLAENAPDRHVVQRGDTLWGIAGKFIKDPWRWPEIWRMNRDQVRNPHRIYPGQIIVLDRTGPSLRVGGVEKVRPKIYEEKSEEPIPTIPQQAIAPFLSEPLVVEAGALDLPKIIATQEDRVYVGAGNTAYATGLSSDAKLWQVYRRARPIRDPETNEVLGYEAAFLGTARLTKAGEPATLEIVSSKREIGRGDRLTPASTPEVITYAPHAPSRALDGRIVHLPDNIFEGGGANIAMVNLGTRDGLEIGHVLAIYRNGRKSLYGTGELTAYREDPASPIERYSLPEERYGLLFVFRTFERLSYGLVMDASRPVARNDFVRTP
jgi:hypothetical protein